MESRNITLTLDKAKEWYKKGGELKEVALQAYVEEELKHRLPKSWEEFCKNYLCKRGECYIDKNCELESIGADFFRTPRIDANVLPSKKAADAHLALMQLHQLRDCYRQGWVPNWEDSNNKYVIERHSKSFNIDWYMNYSHFLSFQTEELATEFLENFRDLIEKAGDLI